VLNNPEQYGFDFIENIITQYVETFTQAHKLGKDFGKKVINSG
jgi:hypothetical protein